MNKSYGRLFDLPQAPPRIVTIDGRTLGIQTFDADNGYPQRMNSIINASPTAKGCVDLFVKYLIGNGCTDTVFYKSKINARGLTPDKLLARIAQDFGRHRGFGIHVNWNALYQVESVSYVPWKNCRLGIEPTQQGRIAVHPDWYNSLRYGQYVSTRGNIDYIWRFNSDPAEIERQVEFAGGWDKYQGQIYWYSPEEDAYPLSNFDSVIDPMMAEIKSNITTKNNIENNFQGKKIWISKGKIEDEKERSEQREVVQDFIGPSGKHVIYFESGGTVDPTSGKALDVPEIIDVVNSLNDKIFQYTDDKVRGQIYRCMNQNAILHSDLTQGRYNQNQLPESQMYYNTLLTPDRLVIEECFQEIFSLFKTPICPSNDYSLIPLPVVVLPTITTDSENANATDNNTK